MSLSKLNVTDYPEVSHSKIIEINTSIDRHNELQKTHGVIKSQFEKENNKQNKLLFVTAPISVLGLLYVFSSGYSDVSGSAIFWSAVLGLSISFGIHSHYANSNEVERTSNVMNNIANDVEAFKKSIEQQRLRNNVNFWLNMTGHEFERQVADLYRRQGFTVRVTRGSGDGGVDLYMSKNGVNYAVQCKNHKKPIGPAAIRDLFGAMTHGQVSNGIFVSSGGYSTAAKEFARNKMELLDIFDIVSMNKRYPNRSLN